MSDQPYRATRFRTALVHFIGGRAAQAGARAVLLLVLVRVLDIEDYGAYMLIIGLAETLLQVASLGILPVGQRYLPQMLTTLSAQKLYGFVSVLTVSQLIILLVILKTLENYWFVITPYMGFDAEQAQNTRSAIWLFLLIPAFRFSAEMLDALLEQGKAQIARALMPTLRVIGVLALIFFASEITLAYVFWVDIAATAFCLTLAWALLGTSLAKLHKHNGAGDIPIKEMIRFAWHMAAAGLLSATSSAGALRLALANTLGLAESGVFAYLQSLQRLVGRYLPGTLLRGLVRPILVDRYNQDKGISILEASAGLLLKCNLIIVAAATIGIATSGNLIVSIASGDKFPDAGLTLLLMFLALGITSQRTVIEMVMQITGHTATLRATALIAPISLALVWFFAEYGLNIAVTIIAFCGALSNWIAMATLIYSTGNFKVDWRGFIAIIAPAALLSLIGMWLATAVNAAAVAAVSILVFLAILRLGKPLRQSEITVIESGAGSRIAGLFKGFASP